MKIFKCLLGLALIGGTLGLGLLYSGLYPMGADVPHNALTYRALETLRERSIARAASSIRVPPLDDPRMLIRGGEDYGAMCAGCHLKPGKTESDFTLGLYPSPPNLTQPEGHAHAESSSVNEAARQFWIIKHGIKASGMAAFGKTHDDARIWDMVAFLQQLPTLTPEEYQILTTPLADSPH